MPRYVHKLLKKPRSKIPVSSSFTTLGFAVQGGLTIEKVQFLVSSASIMKPHLQMFQANASLLTFITTDIKVTGESS